MKVRLTRRRFALGLGAAALGVGVWTWRIEPHLVTVVRREMPVRNLPPELDGKTLAQVSDLHVCPRVDSDYLSACLRELSALQPDLVAVTGDFMSQASPERIEEVARVFESLAAPPLGTFAVLGNHDYGERWSDSRIADQLVRRLTDAGVTVLRNASQVVAGLRIVGVDDKWGAELSPRGRAPNVDRRRTGRGVVPQPRCRGFPRGLGPVPGLDSLRAHARRAVQTAVSGSTATSRVEPALYVGGVRPRGRALAVHQPRVGAPAPGAIQCAPRNHRLPAREGVRHVPEAQLRCVGRSRTVRKLGLFAPRPPGTNHVVAAVRARTE